MTIKHKKVKVYQVLYNPKKEVRTEEFAKAFLAVYNNVRENKKELLDMQLNRDSTIYFIVKSKEDVKSLTDWVYDNFQDIWTYNKTLEVERTVIQDYDDYFDEDILLPDGIEIEDFKEV